MSNPEQIIKSEDELSPVSATGTAAEPAENADENADPATSELGQETPQVFHILGFKKSWETDDITYDYLLADVKNNIHIHTIPVSLNAKLFEPCTIEVNKTGAVSKITPCPTKKTRDEIINDFFTVIKNPHLEGTVKSIYGEGILNVATSTGEVTVFGHKLIDLMGIRKGYHIKVFGNLGEKNGKKQYYANIIVGKEHIKPPTKVQAHKEDEAPAIPEISTIAIDAAAGAILEQTKNAGEKADKNRVEPKPEGPKPEPDPLRVFQIIGFKKSWEDDDVTYDYILADEKNDLRTCTIPISLDAKMFETCTIEVDTSGVVSKITPCPTNKNRSENINDFFEYIKNPQVEGIVKSKNGKGILRVATSTGDVTVFGHKLVDLMGIKKGYQIKVLGDLKEKNCRKQCDAFVILGKEHIKPLKKDKKNKEEEAEITSTPSLAVSHPFLEMARQLQNKIPYHYDPHKLFWVWKNNCWVMADEVDMLNHLKNYMAYTEFFDSRSKTGIMDAIKMSGREREVKEVPKEWVYTLSGVFDIKTKTIHEATPEYFFTNPIPHKIGTSNETPTIDILFKNWAGTKHISLTEWAAYSLYNGYPIHRIHTCFGSGGNGKGQYAEVLVRFVGRDNTCTANLNKLISSRFEGVKLYRKKLCIIDETPTTISSTNEIKALCGDGFVSVEYKGGQGFDMQNTAKITMLTNNVPATKDKTDSWYRRSMITDFPNKFKEGKPIIDTIPEEEYENFLAKCLNILPNLLDKGDFTLDLPLAEKQTVYERPSNRVKHFIEEFCTKGIETPTAMLHKIYNEKFAVKYGCRTLTKQGFNEALGKEGYETYYKEWGVDADRHHQVFVCGIGLKADSNTGDPNLSGQISQ